MTGEVKVYPSLIEGEPAEVHKASGKLGAWLEATCPGYIPGAEQPFVVERDGVVYPPSEWADLEITGDLRMYFAPQGGAFKAIGNVISSIVNAVFGWLMPAQPSMKQQQNIEGVKIKSANAKANQAKLGDAIPEIAGRFRRYPEYLLPPHRYFVNQREQYIEMLLCVGKGKHQIPPERVKVGDTPMISLGSEASFTIYQPGESVAGDTSAQWWHPAPEVGGSSIGTAGLDLRATFDLPQTPSADVYRFDGLNVEIPTGAGEFPEGWEPGLVLRIEAPRAYTVATVGGRTVIRLPEGQDFDDLAPFDGMVTEIVGDNAGQYVVATYTAPDEDQLAEITLNYDSGAPVAGFPEGQASMAIGYRGLRFRTTATSQYSISVQRLTDTGATDSDWEGFAFLETNAALVTLDGSTLEGDWTGPFWACPDGEVTNEIEFDVFFGGGLGGLDKKGRLYTIGVDIELQYRDAATAGAWTSFNRRYEAKTLDQVGFTERLTLNGTFRPEVRMRRIGAASDYTTVQDKVQWYGLRSLLQAPAVYQGVTVMSVKIRGGDRLAAQTENLINLEATRVLPVRADGAWTVETPTRSIAAFVAHVAHSIGYTDQQIDMMELDRLDTVWAARGDAYDWVHDESTVREVINDALQAGFAEMTVERGRIRPVRDEPRSVFEHMYTPQNMTAPLRRGFEAIRPDETDGVDVTYTDSRTWSKETVKCRLPGDEGRKVTKINLEGVTNRTRAWRIGMRLRREMKFRRWSYSIQTELDGLNSRYMSYCAVGDDVPGYGKSCIVEGAEPVSGGVMLALSEPVEFTGNDIVAVRRPDGTLDGPYAATEGPGGLVLANGMQAAPTVDWSMEPPHAVIGTADRWTFPVLIKKIRPNGLDSCTLDGVNYAPEVYADDDSPLPAGA